MITPTPTSPDGLRTTELQPITMPAPRPTARRRIPTWVTIVAFALAFALLVATAFLYVSRNDAIAGRDAAQAQVTSLQSQVTDLQGQLTTSQGELTTAQDKTTALNQKVDACQTAYQIDYQVGTGARQRTPATFNAWVEAMNGCFGTINPSWMKG